MAISVIPFVFPGIDNVRCAFQFLSPGYGTVPAGDPDPFGGNISLSVNDDPERVARNRAELAAICGVSALAEVYQVHGDATVFEPDAVAPGALPSRKADGMATSRPDLGLMIKTADCQPILLAHASGRHVAALHAGWRGNRIGYPISAVREFCARYNLDPADVAAVRGPSLGPSAAQFVNFDQEWGDEFLPWFNASTQIMDLWSLTRYQLGEAGLRPERIFSLDLCTYSLTGAFFSYRRSKIGGRQASMIWIARQ